MRREPIQPGTRVRLPANKKLGWKEEYGTVISDDYHRDVLFIEVDLKYRDKKGDDGMRETMLRLVEIIT